MNKSLYFFFLAVLILIVSGCGLAYRVLLGVDTTPSWNTDEEIVKQATKYDIPNNYNLVFDTAIYYDGLKKIYKRTFKDLIILNQDSSYYHNLLKAYNDDHQPVQFRLFDKKGTEIFKIVNCYIDPPIPMTWNIDGCFDSFPPKTSYKSLDIHSYTLDFLLTKVSLINKNKLKFNDLPVADYYGVIIWNEFFKRPSRRLIKTVRKYIEDTDKSIFLIYINSQNSYLWGIMDSENREEVSKFYIKN